jgi:cross-beta structure silk protein 2
MYTVSIADYTQTLTSQSCADTLESAMPKTEAGITPVFKQNEGYNYCSGTVTYSAQAGHEFYSLNGDKLTGHNRVDALLVALKPLKVSSINSNVSVHDATVTSASDGVKVNQSGGEGKGYFMQWRNSTHQNTFTATVSSPSSTSTSGGSSWLAGGSQGGSGSADGSGSQSAAPDGAQPSAGATSAAPTQGASGSASGSASASSSAKATDYRATIAGADKSQAAAAKQGNSGIVTALWVVGALVVASAAGLGFLLLKRRKQEAAGGDASEA